jgi:hypothetical protein
MFTIIIMLKNLAANRMPHADVAGDAPAFRFSLAGHDWT